MRQKTTKITLFGDDSKATTELINDFGTKGYEVEKISTAAAEPVVCHGSSCVSGHTQIRASYLNEQETKAKGRCGDQD